MIMRELWREGLWETRVMRDTRQRKCEIRETRKSQQTRLYLPVLSPDHCVSRYLPGRV